MYSTSKNGWTDAFFQRSQGWRTVVGVVSDARMRGMGRTHSQMLRDCYLTLDQLPMASVNVFLRAARDRGAAVRTLRDTVRAIDPTRALFDVSTVAASMAEDRQETAFITTVMLPFAGAAVLLTTLGICSVMSHTVSRRTREIGVRVALGADRGSVVGLVLGQTALDMGIGLVIGPGDRRLDRDQRRPDDAVASPRSRAGGRWSVLRKAASSIGSRPATPRR